MPRIDSSDLISVAILAAAGVVSFGWWRRSRRGAAWAVWTVAVLAATVPFLDLHAHTHWANVTITPGWPTLKTTIDAVANVLLYVPFGFFSTPWRPLDRRLARVAGAALLVTLAAEGSQLFSHSRVPSASDLGSNVIGAVVGAWLSARREHPPPA